MDKPPAWMTKTVFEINPWVVQTPQEPQIPVFDDSDDNKKLYGIALAKGATPYEASKQVFSDPNTCVWVTQNWASDPTVLEAKSEYLQSLQVKSKILDKEQFAAKVMEFYEETYEHNGRKFYVNEGKDRLAALGLYAKVMKFTDDKTVEINNNNSNTVNNYMAIKLVSGVKETPKEVSNTQSKILNNDIPQLPVVKLVSGGSR